MWWAAMRACAPCFRASEGIPQQVVVPVERAEFGWAGRRCHRLAGRAAE